MKKTWEKLARKKVKYELIINTFLFSYMYEVSGLNRLGSNRLTQSLMGFLYMFSKVVFYLEKTIFPSTDISANAESCLWTCFHPLVAQGPKTFPIPFVKVFPLPIYLGQGPPTFSYFDLLFV